MTIPVHEQPEIVAINNLLADLGIDSNSMTVRQMMVFLDSIRICEERYQRYGENWRRHGWMSHVIHMQDCFSRLFYMFWERSDDIETDRAKDIDAAYDLINYAGFFIRCHKAGEKFGMDLPEAAE